MRGEEEYMVSHLNSFRYVEMDGEFIETPCQNFEEVPQTLASTEVVADKPPMKMASFKDVRAIIKKGGCANWGQLPDFAYKTDKFGLGFMQRLKGLFGAHGSEDLLCISVIRE